MGRPVESTEPRMRQARDLVDVFHGQARDACRDDNSVALLSRADELIVALEDLFPELTAPEG